MPESLQVLRCKLSDEAISVALMLTPEQTAELFNDGRLVGWLAKIWGERLFKYRRYGLNHPGPNGCYPLPARANSVEHKVHVRCFRDDIKFQRSGNMGVGRKCSQDDVITMLRGLETYVLVDIRGFPLLDFYPLDTKSLLPFAHDGQLTRSGMSAKKFDRWVRTAFDVSVLSENLDPGWDNTEYD